MVQFQQRNVPDYQGRGRSAVLGRVGTLQGETRGEGHRGTMWRTRGILLMTDWVPGSTVGVVEGHLMRSDHGTSSPALTRIREAQGGLAGGSCMSRAPSPQLAFPEGSLGNMSDRSRILNVV